MSNSVMIRRDEEFAMRLAEEGSEFLNATEKVEEDEEPGREPKQPRRRRTEIDASFAMKLATGMLDMPEEDSREQNFTKDTKFTEDASLEVEKRLEDPTESPPLPCPAETFKHETAANIKNTTKPTGIHTRAVLSRYSEGDVDSIDETNESLSNRAQQTQRSIDRPYSGQSAHSLQQNMRLSHERSLNHGGHKLDGQSEKSSHSVAREGSQNSTRSFEARPPSNIRHVSGDQAGRGELNEAVSARPLVAHHRQPSLGVIPRYDKNGRLLDDQARAEIAKRQGICITCGVRLTVRKGLGLSRKPLTNDQVYQGKCIRCDPRMVPLTVRKNWEAAEYKKRRSLLKTRSDILP